MKGPATELIHAGETERGVAVPLTTPIYETTTFIFDNAQEVANGEGRSKNTSIPATNPTVVSVEQARRHRSRRTALTLSSAWARRPRF
jgi:O-acetylhomoserine/O-acetylserine sulfhydrylase-like pyridoxal-dependent enzyme